jgi:hypothetical protein
MNEGLIRLGLGLKFLQLYVLNSGSSKLSFMHCFLQFPHHSSE